MFLIPSWLSYRPCQICQILIITGMIVNLSYDQTSKTGARWNFNEWYKTLSRFWTKIFISVTSLVENLATSVFYFNTSTVLSFHDGKKGPQKTNPLHSKQVRESGSNCNRFKLCIFLTDVCSTWEIASILL